MDKNNNLFTISSEQEIKKSLLYFFEQHRIEIEKMSWIEIYNAWSNTNNLTLNDKDCELICNIFKSMKSTDYSLIMEALNN